MNIETLYKILFFISLYLIYFSADAQKLQQSRQNSCQTYIYKLNQEEAKQIYKKNLWVVDSSFFHTLIDSLPQGKKYETKLESGYYLKTYFERNKQKFHIASVQDFDVHILNNSTDLSIQIYDLEGKIIPNVKVRVRHKKLHFDKKTQSYLGKKSNQKGLLSITFDGFTAYYELERRINNPRAKRIANKFLNKTPLKYAWRPIRFTALLPRDAIRSIKNYGTYGGIERTKHFFVKSYYKVACFFDNYYCDEYYDGRIDFDDKHTGYFVFNKAKYKQGDTVKFKAFISTQKGKPINKTVEVRIWGGNTKEKVLTKLKPYRKGAYEYEFTLHDSLDLKLDTNYKIALSLNEDKTYISKKFHYEEYELAQTKLSIRLSSETQYKNEPFKLHVKGTDENDLNLLDARLEITLKSKQTNAYFAEHIFVPDTLLFLEQKLSPEGETEILLADSTFAKVNFDYEITVKMLTSDNQSIYKNKTVHFFHFKKEFDIKLQADSIAFTFKENGEQKPKAVKIFTADSFGNKNKIYEGKTPYKIKINPYFAQYIIQSIESDNLKKSIDILAESSFLQCFSSRTHNSIDITVDNPRRIPFTYYIYKKNTQKSRGYNKSLTFKRKTTSKENYLVYLRYLWGGEIMEENYPIRYLDRLLNISVSQPNRVYPSQKTKIEILVTDAKGKPVPDVDLTAYSMTKKFNYSPPSLPYFQKRRKTKNFINSFEIKYIRLKKTSSINLDYRKWGKFAQLDSIEYYKFIYPQNDIYKFTYQPSDSITQFAPFVLENGKFNPIHVIYVDYKPVYFSWSTNYQPYSFKIDAGFHQIKLRTAHREITLDSLYFEEGKKLIFSLNQDLNQPKIRIEKLADTLSWQEQSVLHRYIFPYRDNLYPNYAYLENNETIQFLNLGTKRHQRNLAGPVSGKISFHLLDSSSIDFVHEPFFEYDILLSDDSRKPTFFKLRTVKRSNYPDYLSSQQKPKNLDDLVLTKKILQKKWEELIKEKRRTTPKYTYPTANKIGTGRLRINFVPTKENTADTHLNILIFQHKKPSFLRIYPGKVSEFHQLKKGLYQLVFFYPNGQYFIADSIDIQVNGLNFYEIKEPKILKKDSFSTQVHDIIENNVFKSYSYEQSELEKIKLNYVSYKHQEEFDNYTDEFKFIEGYVLDESGEALPGATVQVKGTTHGVVTNLDGYYSIRVPINRHELIFSFVGINSKERIIENSGVVNVEMEDSLELSEMVVTAMGRVTKRSLSQSISLQNAMAGRAVGVQVLGDLGGGSTFKIRGMSSVLSENSALYVVDGVPYNGNDIEIKPEMIANIKVLKGEEATALYGSRAVNGVVLISTQKGVKLPKELTLKNKSNQSFFDAASKASSIRNNFSDYAFWQPKLKTNKQGKASFEVIFPDDITSWDTFYLAMNGDKQSGQSKSSIKSYKPLMARLALPRFLVESDTAFAIGKILNYSSDSLELTRKFEVNQKQVFAKKAYCDKSIIDTLVIHPEINSDSISLKYFLEKEDGYFDGEVRKIPVFPVGIEQTKGNFYRLEQDTTFDLTFDSTFKKVKLYARASMLEILEDEIQHLSDYKYLCNEQAASKLKATLNQKRIAKYRGKPFKFDKNIKNLILLLRKRQNNDKTWGWWSNSTGIPWISLHVLESLTLAQSLGFQIHIDKDEIITILVSKLGQAKGFATKIRILKILTLLNAQINYKSYISELEKINNRSFNGFLQILELKKANKLECNLDTLKSFQKETLFGSVFYAKNTLLKSTHWFDRSIFINDIQNTLLVYKLLKYDSLGNARLLPKIRSYFLEERKSGYWTNTYESAKIIETILPDLLVKKSKLSPATLQFTGDLEKTITKFPLEMEIDSKSQIKLTKSGDFPIYLSTFQKYWDKNPVEKKNDFEIRTYFENHSDNAKTFLKAGKNVKLIVKVVVKKDAEYLMINVPIPAACSYGSKKNNFIYEVHREYFKNETSIFCQSLKRGNYTFEIELIPRYTGTYVLNPAKIELMYFPVFNANNGLKKVLVE